MLYKLPKISDSKNKLIQEGVAYLYMDSSSFLFGWKLSDKDISKNDSIPAYTLSSFYDDVRPLSYLFLKD